MSQWAHQVGGEECAGVYGCTYYFRRVLGPPEGSDRVIERGIREDIELEYKEAGFLFRTLLDMQGLKALFDIYWKIRWLNRRDVRCLIHDIKKAVHVNVPVHYMGNTSLLSFPSSIQGFRTPCVRHSPGGVSRDGTCHSTLCASREAFKPATLDGASRLVLEPLFLRILTGVGPLSLMPWNKGQWVPRERRE